LPALEDAIRSAKGAKGGEFGSSRLYRAVTLSETELENLGMHALARRRRKGK